MSQQPRNDRAQGPAGGELLMACAVQFDAQAAGDGGATAAKPRRFSMNAYTGGAMQLVGWRYPVVVDLTGLVASNKPKVFLEHDRTARVGHIDDVQVGPSALAVCGVVSASGRAAQEVLADAANGFPWQASIGARAIEVEWVPEGHSAQANGRMFQGPVNIARKAVLGEVSFVALGADDNTSAQIAATKETAMPQNSAESQTASTTPTAATITAAQEAPGQTPEQMRAATAAEMKRIAGIQKVAAKHADIAAKAVEEGWDVTRAELEVLRADRPQAPAAHVPDNSVTDDLLLAAACQSGQLQGMEKAFDTKVLEAAHRRFHGRLGLQRLIMEAAWANGHVGRSFEDDRDGALRAAFSTLRLPGILQNIANKFLLAGFLSVENAWQRISATRSVRDFKAVTSYRMSGAFEYDEVGPDGELKHGEVGEESFTNQAKTYGKTSSTTTWAP